MEPKINIIRVEKERLKRGWTKKVMAGKFGLTRQGLYDLMHRKPTIRTVERICRVMELQFDDIIEISRTKKRKAA